MDSYEVIGKIGKGSFGLVSHIRRKSDGKDFVWKEFDYGQMNEKEKQLIVTEVNILRELRHSNIVRYFDRIIDKEKTKLYIVMEYCQAGDLGQYIKRKKRERKYIDEGMIWKIFLQLLSALKECHRRREGNVLKPILHRDIKPGNVFLSSEDVAKLGDFGLAKELSDSVRFTRTNVGTPYYMSPEMVLEEAYDERSDIWALGCLVYEMAALSPPFEATNQMALAMKIRRGVYAPIPSRYTSSLHDIIGRMLRTDQADRAQIEELIQLANTGSRQYQFSPTPMSPTPSSSQAITQTYLTKMKELRNIEANLKRQEEHLKRQEAALSSRERLCSEREMELQRREKELILRENRMQSSSHVRPFPLVPIHSPDYRVYKEQINNIDYRKEAESPEIKESVAKYQSRKQYRKNYVRGMGNTDWVGNTDVIFKSLHLNEERSLSPSSSSESPIGSDSSNSTVDEQRRKWRY